MASGPITAWQIEGENVEVVIDFLLLGSKITADSDRSHGIKTPALWKESYDKPRQHIKKQRQSKDLYQQRSSKAMVFPVVKYGCESWTIKKAEHQRIDAFKLWCGEDS